VLVEDIRSQRFSAEAEDTANLLGEHINFPAKRITLYRMKTDTGYSIPIFPQLLPFLRKLETKGQICKGQKVFKVRDPNRAMTAVCKRLGLPHFSPRSLR
jgi:integrase